MFQAIQLLNQSMMLQSSNNINTQSIKLNKQSSNKLQSNQDQVNKKNKRNSVDHLLAKSFTK